MNDARPGEPEPGRPEASPEDRHDPAVAGHGADEEVEPLPRRDIPATDSDDVGVDVGDEEAEHDASSDIVPEPVTFDRQPLASTVRWVWLGGYLVPVAIVSLIAAQLDVLVLETAGGLVTILTFVTAVALAVWRTVTRYRAWSWELTERQLIIDRGVVFELTRIVPRARVQHVDISSGPLDRFFGLRQLSIYTAGTREADASIPGLTADRAEELRAALIGS